MKMRKSIDFEIEDISYTYFGVHIVVPGFKLKICAALFSSAIPILIGGTIYGYKR